MYAEFINALLVYLTALNNAQDSIEEKEGLTPYLGRVEVMLEGEVVGHFVDSDGIGFRYEAAV